MENINLLQNQILTILLQYQSWSSSQIYHHLQLAQNKLSQVTVKRALSKLVLQKYITSSGGGRSIVYSISNLGRLFSQIDSKTYNSIEPDRRYGQSHYNFDLFNLSIDDVFSSEEIEKLNIATAQFNKNGQNISSQINKKELERLVIELSWKSSKIEGNTYNLLDTEKLILENKLADGHSREESQMILNHKFAFEFVLSHISDYRSINKQNIENIHSLMVKDLSVKSGFRHSLVGITGSKYRPLDNIFQISDAVDSLSHLINQLKSPYSKALLSLLGLCYIQPFEDGNKRTARLLTNAILMAHGCAPLSYRSVDEVEYREATLTFYELNSIVPFKKIFIEQYLFATQNYSIKI